MIVELLRTIPESEYRSKAFNNLQKNKENNRALAKQLGNPEKLFYPAGRSDIDHMTMPSVRVMAIVDIMPLLLSETYPDKSYSTSIHGILESYNGNYVDFPELFNEPSFLGSQQAELVYKMQSALEKKIRYIASGYSYDPSHDRRKKDVKGDCFAELLARMILLGGALNTMKIGKFGEDLRVQFDLDGDNKTVIFRNTQIDEDFSKKGSESFLWAQKCFDDFGAGSTAVVVKADLQGTAQHVIEAVDPDIIFGIGSSMKNIMFFNPKAQGYDFTDIDANALPHPQQDWGYNQIRNMHIGRKRSKWFNLKRNGSRTS